MPEKKKKILIAEDEKPMAHALELKLSHEGYAVLAVHNGQDAIDATSKEDFDLLVLDLMMPKVDGFAVLEHLRSEGKHVPVIILSNLSQEEDERKARTLGAKKFFIKSNTPLKDIVQEIENMLQ